MVAATENFICDFIGGSNVTDNDLFALSNHFSADSTGVVCGARSTPAQGFNLQCVHSVS
jgi:hypothetical protein